MIPSMRTSARLVYGGRCSRSVTGSGPTQSLAADGVAVFGCCKASGPGGKAVRLEAAVYELDQGGFFRVRGCSPRRSGCLCGPQHRTVSDPRDAN